MPTHKVFGGFWKTSLRLEFYLKTLFFTPWIDLGKFLVVFVCFTLRIPSRKFLGLIGRSKIPRTQVTGLNRGSLGLVNRACHKGFWTLLKCSVVHSILGDDTVDGSESWRAPVEVGSLSHYLHIFTQTTSHITYGIPWWTCPWTNSCPRSI